tara:strand:+ start:1487 stop:1804 length:318 start_codon:yes stop_codon:yes gene_type:complete
MTEQNWLNPEAVIEAVVQVSGIPRDSVMGRGRSLHLMMARKVLAHLLYERSNMAYTGIAHLMDGRDHTSVMYLNRQALNLPHPLVKLYESKAEQLHRQILNNVTL